MTAPDNAVGRVEKKYTAALQRYLSEPNEGALVRAYELGRSALADGLSLLEMVTAHSRAMSSVLSRRMTDEERMRVLQAQANFFIEALSPFEMTHRSFGEANTVLRRLNDVLEEQAKRIASALHDEAAQLLVPVHLVIADIAAELPVEKSKQLSAVRGLLNKIEERLRHISHELRPPVLEDRGLFSALELLADGVSKRWGLPVSVNASIDAAVPPSVETTVYRIAQEALTNAAKHARATRADIDLRQTGHNIICSVRDDGIGFEPTGGSPRKGAAGLGLLGIKERVAALGGSMRLDSQKNRGTELTVEIPLER